MSDPRPVPTESPSVSRRRFLEIGGAGVAAGSLLTMLDARQAPAQIKGTNLRMLLWSHYVPAYDVWFDKFTKEWGDKTGVKVRVDHMPHLELPARYAAEFAAGSGHDLIYFVGQILTGQYYRNLVDLSDLADGLGKKYGGWLETSKSAAQVNGVWYAVPDFFISIPVLWRKDLFASIGMREPKTWDDLRKAAGQLKAKGHPTGMQFSHCNDANHNWRALMFCFGVKETDPSGQNIMIDSKEMRESLRFGKALYRRGHDARGLLLGRCLRQPLPRLGRGQLDPRRDLRLPLDRITNPKVFKNTFMVRKPTGPGGQRGTCASPTSGHLEVLEEHPGRQGIPRAPRGQRQGRHEPSPGYNMPFLNDHYKKPMPYLGTDPKMRGLQDQEKIIAFFGYPGADDTAAPRRS